MTANEYKNLIPKYDNQGIYTMLGGERKEIMNESERPWLPIAVKAICKKVRPKSVMEVGFGLGISCQAFQDYGLQRHLILEPNKVIADKARKWATGTNVQIVEEFVQNYKTREKFDLIYDDRYEFVYTDPDWKKFGFDYLAYWTANDKEAQDSIIPEYLGRFKYKYNNKEYIHGLIKKTDL